MSYDLAIIPPIAVPSCFTPAEAAAELNAAMSFAMQETSEGTRRAYASDWKIFCAFCDARGLTSLPAAPATAARFLSHQATSAKKSSTIGRRAAAISHHHRLAGHEPPTNSEAVRATVRGIRRAIGCAPKQKTAATADIIRTMLDACPNTLIGTRDRALISLGFAAALRRSELVALRVEDLIEVPDGYRLVIKRSKTDQEQLGVQIAVPRGYRLRPVEAVQAWLAAAGITTGPVFRSIGKGARVQSAALSGHSAGAVVKAAAARIGLDASSFGGHSLRAGFATSAAAAGATVWKLQAVTRHKSLDVLSSYVRDADAFKDHAGAAFL